MFLRKTQRKKDGKTHDYWSVVENKRVWQAGVSYSATFSGRWARSTPRRRQGGERPSRFLDDDAGLPRTLALFPEDRCAAVASDVRRSFSFACRTCGCVGRGNWRRLLAGRAVVAGSAVGAVLGRAPAAEPQGVRAGIRVLHVLVSLSIDRTGQRVEVAPRLVRQRAPWPTCWGRTSGQAEAHKLCACHDFLLQHKDALFSHLTARWWRPVLSEF